jgi:hypothetical protein
MSALTEDSVRTGWQRAGAGQSFVRRGIGPGPEDAAQKGVAFRPRWKADGTLDQFRQRRRARVKIDPLNCLRP